MTTIQFKLENIEHRYENNEIIIRYTNEKHNSKFFIIRDINNYNHIEKYCNINTYGQPIKKEYGFYQDNKNNLEPLIKVKISGIKKSRWIKASYLEKINK